jgi:spermidine synthase
MALDDRWCTEVAPHEGMATSFRIEERLADERSAWQRLEVVRTSTFGNLMLLDGCTMVSERDEFIYHEMVSHPVLFSHADPRRVVIVGGGDCGTLREVLRHPTVTECWQVEIDERVTRLAERHFPSLTAANGDPRAHLHFGDGLAWVRDAPDASVDVVIVDSTDPVGPAEGLFGERFYRDCHRALGAGGFVVQQSESPILNTGLIVAMHRALRAAGFADVRTLTFPQPIYPSGWWSATMARKGARIEGFREHDAAALSGLRYYTPAIHRAAFALPAFLEKELQKVG